MRTSVPKVTSLWAALVAAGIFLASPPLAQARGLEESVAFDIPAQSLENALFALSRQSAYQIVFTSGSLPRRSVAPLSGRMPLKQALEKLLEGTQLGYKLVGERTITVGPPASASSPAPATNESAAVAGADITLRLVNNDAQGVSGPAAAQGKQEDSAAPRHDGNKESAHESELVVTGSRLPRTEIEGASPVLTYDREYIERSGFGTLEEFMRVLPQNFSASGAGRQTVPNDENPVLIARQPGQSGLGLRGLGSNNTLVLINGRRAPLSGIGNRGTPTQQSFFDINTIPIGLIERIEVLTDGASAVYGTDAIAGVVNIILKEEYNASEVRTRFAGTQHGGGFERGVTATHGFSVGRFQATTTLDGFDRQGIQASQRAFSASSDHTAQGGSDFRSNIGYPNTIFALPGQSLPGLFNPDGTPARQAVVPSGQDGKNLTPADFAATAGAQTLYDQSELYALVTPNQRYGLSSRLNFRANDRLTVFGEIGYTYNDSTALANPLVSSNANGNASFGRIPANNPYNPFGVPLGIRMAHVELGPRNFTAETKSTRALAGMQLELGRDWSAEASVMYYLQDFFQSSPSVDNVALQAALNQTDPALALNLFGDYTSVGPTNAPGVYEAIIRDSITNSDSAVYNADFLFRGSLWTLPGGQVRAAFGGEWNNQDRLQTLNTPSTVAPERSHEVRDDYAAYTELQVPLFSSSNARRMLRRLELQFAGRWQKIENSGESVDPKYGLLWSPTKALLFRASFGTGYRAPALSELERPESERNQTVLDPRRPGDAAYSVSVLSGSFPNLGPETSRTYGYGVVVQVPWIQGLSFGLDGYRKDQKNLTASLSSTQLLEFEELFPSRIVREEPSAGDIAAGWAGPIVEIDGRFSNFGRVVTEGWDLNATYDLNTSELGRFVFRATATWMGSYKVAFNPGDPLEERQGTFGFPQKLKGNVSVFWNRGRWGASLFCYHQGEAERSATDRVSSWTTFDTNVTFDLNESLRLQGGVGNLLDEEPPFADTIWGFDGGFHNPRMRSYSLSATYRF